MKIYFWLLLNLMLVSLISGQVAVKNNSTYCNPINLSYRYCLDLPSRREAADPTVIIYKNEYFMFASKSGGYWHSTDLQKWDLILTNDLPLEEYAPTAEVVGDWIYFMASGENSPILKTNNPKSGKWEIVNKAFPFQVLDPDLFYDEGKMYLYYGCSNKNPIYVVELDLNNNLNPIGNSTPLFVGEPKIHGWEKQGDNNELNSSPWIEGSWMNKYKDQYYLQYAGPGTEFKSYADGVYVSKSPFGPFLYQKYNPFSLKQGGFICGAGHGSTFKDLAGNYWHIATQTISVKHMFERRIGLFPAFFTNENELFADTKWGDYPHFINDQKERRKNSFTGWMLLSYNKNATASSTLDSSKIEYALDENIRTHWSAKTGNKGEWFEVDLKHECLIKALQINFADQDCQIVGAGDNIYYQYIVEYSVDGKRWKFLIDKSENKIDSPHDYIELKKPVLAKYLKITNLYTPSGKFALSGFRVFGNGNGVKAKPINNFAVERNLADKRCANLKWEKDDLADGSIINYGVSKNKLNNHLMVYCKNEIEINGLNIDCEYYFSIDSFNENGFVLGKTIKKVE